MNSRKNVRTLARLAALGLTLSVAGVASAQTEGDKTPNSRKVVIGIVNPAAGVVTQPFRVQVRVFSPKAADDITVQPIGTVTLSWTGTGTGSLTLGRNSKYGTASDSGVWEGTVSGLTVGGSYTFRASGTNTTPANAVSSGPVTVTVGGNGDGNLLVRDNSAQLCSDCHLHETHSSQSTGPTKYGSWWVGCRTCHQPHDTTNASLIATQIQPPGVNVTLPPHQVVFSSRRGYSAAGGAANPAVASFANGDATGVCQVCHTQVTKAFKNDGTLTNHNPTSNCTTCHSHKKGFAAQCNTCHGAAAGRTPDPSITGTTDALLSGAPPVTPTTAAPLVANGGLHLAHVNKATYRKDALACADCHANYVHGDGDIDLGWSATRAAADGAVVYPPAGTTASTTGWVSTPTCTNYCHGATLADGSPATKKAVSWNTAQVLDCGSCHGYPPLTIHGGSAHTTSTTCTTCHPGYSDTGLTDAAKQTHINGQVEGVACDGCHGNPDRVATAGADSAVTAAPPQKDGGTLPGVVTDVEVGAHEIHVNNGAATALSNPIHCDVCHPTPIGSTHAAVRGSENGQVVFNPGTVATSNGKVPAAWNRTTPSCSSTWCHSVTGTAASPLWTSTAGRLGCTACHPTTASTTGSHAGHVADSPAYKGTTFGCVTCHSTANDTAILIKGQHVNGQKEVSAAGWNGTACATNACHSDGRETPNYVSATWGTTLANDCKGCHGREVGSIAGAPWYANVANDVQSQNSHDKHLKAGDTAAACNKCHASTVNATGNLIAAGHLDLNGVPEIQGTSIGSYDDTTETCTNVSCHGTNSARWGATLGCTGCHGDASRAQVATTVDTNFRSAPPYDLSKSLTGLRVGAHVKHTNSSTYRQAGLACADCHPAAVSHNGTRDAAWSATASYNPRANYTIAPAAGNGAYSTAWETTPTCTNWCHGDGLAGGGRGLTWNWGTPPTMGCNSCHGQATVAMPAVATAHHPQNSKCDSCHPAGYLTTGLSATAKQTHVDATIQKPANGCTACHGTLAGFGGAAVTNNLDPNAAPGYVANASADTKGNVLTSFVGVGAHNAHLTSALLPSAAKACSVCHGTQPASLDTLHADGTVRASWSSPANAAAQTPTPAAFDAAFELSPNCTNYCHSTGVPLSGSIAKASVTWTTTPVITCASCHGDKASITSNAHEWHLAAGNAYAECQTCHQATATASTAIVAAGGSHVNGTNNVVYDTLGDPRTTGATWTSPNCGALYCHSNATPAQGANSNKTVAWNATAWIRSGATANECTQCHAMQADATISPTSTNLSHGHYAHATTYGYTCQRCHNGIATGAANYPTTAGAISSTALHVNKAKDVAFDAPNTGAAPYGQGTPSTCSNTYCHSDGQDRTAPFTSGPSIAWNSATGATCGTCHNSGTAMATRSHGAHVNNAALLGANLGCITCHDTVSNDTTINAAKRAQHVNAAVEVPGTSYSDLTSDGVANGTCAANACHSNGTENLVTADYKSVTWGVAQGKGCKLCHGSSGTSLLGEPDYANDTASYKTRNSHAAHVKSGDTLAVCNVCHSGTVGATGALTGTVHLDLNGVADVAGTSIGSYTDATETCNTVSCHGGASPQWGATLGCRGCHGAQTTAATDDDVDDYTFTSLTAPGTLSKIDLDEWTANGHGATSLSTESNNAAPNFDAAGTADGCVYCHNMGVPHGNANNFFRLANVGTGTTIAEKNGVCTVCHDGAGYLGKTASAATQIGATHYGADHTSGTVTRGGQLCWDCHDPHGDRSGANRLAYMIQKQPVRTHADATNVQAEWGLGTPTYAATPDFRRALGTNATGWDWGDYVKSTTPFTGVCQVCHTKTTHFTNATWSTTIPSHSDADSTHNVGKVCTTCHAHNQKPSDAFRASCSGCHGNKGAARTPVTANADAMLDYAPPTAADTTTSATTANGVGAHQSHVNQTTLRTDPLLCSECHGPSASLPRHPGTGLAYTEFGTLAKTGAVSPTYTRGTGCASTYCHGNFKNGNDQITGATVAPGVPGVLTFTGVGIDTITVNWGAATDATLYKVERGASSTGPWVQIGLPSSTSFVDGGLTAGTTYWYRVRAWNEIGESTYNTPLSRATSPAGGAPTAMVYDWQWTSAGSFAGLTANLPNLACGDTSYPTQTAAMVTTMSTTANTCVMRLYTSVGGVANTPLLTIVLSAPYATDMGISAGSVVWTQRAAAATTVGVQLGYVQTGTFTGFGSPVNVNLTATSVTAATTSLAAQTGTVPAGASLALRYTRVTTDTNIIRFYFSTTEGITNVTETPPAVTPPPAPTGTPVLTMGALTSTSAAMSWTASTDATSYIVERGLGASPATWTQVGQPTGLTFADKALTASTTYSYRVRGTNVNGATANSTARTVTTSAAGALATSWTGTFTPGATTLTCVSCHGDPPGGTHPNMTNCSLCHPGYGDFAASNQVIDKAQHINGVVDMTTDCAVCHAVQLGSRRPVVAEFTNTWSHKRSFTGTPKVNKWDCIVCHMEGDASGSLSTTYHMNGKLNFRDPDTGTNIMAATGFNQAVYTDSTNGGAYVFSTSVEAAPVAFGRNLGVAFQADPNWLDLAAVQVKLCLGCHDSDGAKMFLPTGALYAFAQAQTPVFTPEKPFGQTISGAGYTGAGITANGMLGGVTDVKASFVTTNASYHPILGKQNNSYVGNTKMNAPWNTLPTNKTGGTINTATSWGYLISCWDCHAPNGASGPQTVSVTAHGGATTIRQAVWSSSSTATNNLCRVCHNVATTQSGHGTGSAAATVDNHAGPYMVSQCYQCHSSARIKPGRPIPAQDAHGFDSFAPAMGTDTMWPLGATNTWRPYAFFRNVGTGNSWSRTTSAWRPTSGPGVPAGTANCAGECNGESASATYTPGGVY